ncbi:OmpA family protein [Ancylomarina sp. YFZ004]
MKKIKNYILHQLILILAIGLGSFHIVSANNLNTETKNNFPTLLETKAKLGLFDKIRLDAAERDFSSEAYSFAIQRYEKIVSKGDTLTFLVQRLAESYLKINQPTDSEFWYKKLDETDLMSESDFNNYAEVLKMNEKYDEALSINKKNALLHKLEPNTSEFSPQIIQKLKSDSLRYEVISSLINSDASDMGPSFIDGQIIFASARKKTFFNRTNRRNVEPYLDLYCSNVKTDGTLDTVVPYGRHINTKYHESSVTYSKSEDAIYYTTNYASLDDVDEDKINNLRIVRSKKTDKGWGKFEVLPFNNPSYSYAHPSISDDGNQLYFSSNMPGGIGATDIYVCNRVNGKWSDPINLGKTINTKENEMFPYIYKNKALYFSSNSKLGLGGLDIYYSNIENNTYSKAQNMGYPINSSFDDFGLVFVKNRFRGFISSNRSRKTKDDIYSILIKPLAPKAVNDYFVMDVKEGFITIDPLTNDSRGDAEKISVTNYAPKSINNGLFEKDEASGLFKYTCSPDFVGIDTISYALAYDLPYTDDKCEAKIIITVNSIEKEIQDEINNFLAELFFDFDKSNIREDADRTINTIIIPFMNKYPQVQFELSAHTDALGSENYNMKLANKRAKAVISYLKKKQLDVSRVKTQVYGEQEAKQVDYKKNRGELQPDRKVQLKTIQIQ